ncbi:MAG: cyclic nucleotide-binding domain-containing protein [Methylococcales bacterium]|jgi:glutaminase|nr:cyclic nucleotide-binding domain-containing protein [Methylococcales bacterium]MBT7408933.1 cyclic nucleotide-binding domain-containing protein [Methylococcales bacterium]
MPGNKLLHSGFSIAKATGLLQKLPLFQGMFNDEFGVLLDYCNICQFSRDKIIFKENDVAESMFIVLKGRVEVSCQKKGVLRIMEQGEVLGEIGIIMKIGRTATAKSYSDELILLEIKKTDFDFILGKCPRASYIIMKNMAKFLAERLILANQIECCAHIISADKEIGKKIKKTKKTEI